MQTNSGMVCDDGGSRVTFNPLPGTRRFIVRTDAWRTEGIFPNDVLIVQEAGHLSNGDWAILEFDTKKIIREVEILGDLIRFKPLNASLQAIDWPAYRPAPVIGVVKTIIRHWQEQFIMPPEAMRQDS